MRLRNAEIIEKDSEGFFNLTSFGKIILRLLPGLEFASNNREYFLYHDLSLLPLEFNERLGELCDSEFTDRVGPLLSYIQQTVTEAEEYIWLMADHPIGGDEYVGGKKLETSNVKWRVIIPRGTDFDETTLRSPPLLTKHKGRIEYALIADSNDIKAGIVLNEKRAGVSFPDMTGKLDFNSGLGVTTRYFINGVLIFLIFIGTRQQEKWWYSLDVWANSIGFLFFLYLFSWSIYIKRNNQHIVYW